MLRALWSLGCGLVHRDIGASKSYSVSRRLAPVCSVYPWECISRLIVLPVRSWVSIHLGTVAGGSLSLCSFAFATPFLSFLFPPYVLFLCGLLCDIGRMILTTARPATFIRQL